MTETIWILGGSGDIGRAIGRRFGREGWALWLSARGEARLADARAELVDAGSTVETVRADAAVPEDVRGAVDAIADGTDRIEALVYNVTPQALDGVDRLLAFHRHTVGGMHVALERMAERDVLPTHVIVPTSSRARTPGRASPEAYAAKQSLFAYLAARAQRDDGVSYTILWLGRRGTETDWRWLRPAEMAAVAWTAYDTREAELLVGDLY